MTGEIGLVWEIMGGIVGIAIFLLLRSLWEKNAEAQRTTLQRILRSNELHVAAAKYWQQKRLDLVQPLDGNKLKIKVEDLRTPGQSIIRRYTPACKTPAWELHVAVSEEGIEYFSYTAHPFADKTCLEVCATTKRPIYPESAWHATFSTKIGEDGYYDNRLRYLHNEQGLRDWFIVKVTGLYDEKKITKTWLFEHESLYGEVLRSRPALPAPPAPPDISTVEKYVKTFDGRAHVEKIAADVQALREELPTLVKAKYDYQGSSQALEDLLAEIEQAATAEQAAHAKIDALTGIGDDRKEDFKEIVRTEASKNQMKLQRAVEADLAKSRRGRL